MNLGLQDILTVQQVDSPAYKKAEVKDRGDSSVASISKASKSDKTFDSHLDAIKEKITSEESFDSPVYSNPFHNEAVTFNNEVISNTSKQTLGGFGVAASKLGFSSVESADKGFGLNQLFNALNALKDSGFPIPQGSPIAGLLSLQENGDISFELSNALQGVAGGTLLDLVQQVANGDLNVDLNNVEGIDNLGEVINLIKSIAGEVSSNLNNIPDLSRNSENLGAAVKEAAGQIIHTAKSEAESHEISDIAIKSEQVLSLLSAVKKENTPENGNSNSVVQKAGEALPSLVNSELNKQNNKLNIDSINNKSENKSENIEVLNNKLAKIDAGASGLEAAKNIVNHSNKNSSNQSEVNAAKFSEINLNTNILASQEVGGNNTPIKIGNYFDVSQGANEVDKNISSHSSKDVMAQIKFGISASAGKNNGNITIQLHPKELGSVDVRMEMGNDGKTRVAIIAEKVDTMNLLQKDASSLKEMLQDALHTESANLSFSFHSNGDEAWKEFLNNGSNFAEQNVASTDEEVAPDAVSGYQYQQNFIATEGLDIRV